MKSRRIIPWVLLNVLALVAGAYYLRNPSAPNLPEIRPATSSQLAGFVLDQAEKPNPIQPTMVVVHTNQIRWRELESSDYKQYIANLRSIGCPERTIRDIILTDVMKLYAGRRGQISDNGREFKFWETDEKSSLTVRQAAERDRQLALIDRQMPGVLRELLGINYERELNKYFIDTKEDEKRLGFLPPEKQEELIALRDRFDNMRDQIYERAVDGQLAPGDLEQLRAIQQLRQSMLAASLSPAQLEEYELRTSETAERLRLELVGFQPTADEFRQLHALWREFDQRFAYTGTVQQAEMKAERQRIEEQIKTILSPERAAEYQRSQNQDFQNSVYFAERHELPSLTAQTVFEMKQIAEDVKNRLLENADLNSQSQKAALAALQAEIERSFTAFLGESAYQDYRKDAGAWISRLGTQ